MQVYRLWKESHADCSVLCKWWDMKMPMYDAVYSDITTKLRCHWNHVWFRQSNEIKGKNTNFMEESRKYKQLPVAMFSVERLLQSSSFAVSFSIITFMNNNKLAYRQLPRYISNRDTHQDRYAVLVFCIQCRDCRHGHGSIFQSPTQPIMIHTQPNSTYKSNSSTWPNSTKPTVIHYIFLSQDLFSNPTQPNPP